MAFNDRSDAQRTREVRSRHRREVRWQILLPALASFLVVVVLVPLALLAVFSDRQINIVASFAAVMILVPTAVLCLLPYVLMIFLVAGTVKLRRMMPRVLRVGRNIAHGANVGAHSLSQRVSAPIVSVSTRLAWLERVSGHEPPSAR